MRHRYLFTVLTVLMCILGSAVAALATDFTVTIPTSGAMVFSPSNQVVNVGDRVAWRNRQPIQHTATSGTSCTPNGLWDTGILNPNVTSAFVTFNTPGVFPYYCQIHCLMNMVGTITVNPPVVAVEGRTWGGIKALYRIDQE